MRLPSLLDEVMSAAEAADLIQDDVTIGMSSFTRAGEAEAVPQALAIRIKERPLRISLMAGTGLDNDLDKQLTKTGVLARHMPLQIDNILHKAVNADEVMFVNQHLLGTVEQLRDHQPRLSDIAVTETAMITKQGHIVPTTLVGNSASFAIFTRQVIVKINLAHSTNLGGPHDIHVPTYRPACTPIPLAHVDDRTGNTVIPIPPEKIIAIVISNQPDSLSTVLPPDNETQAIASHLTDSSKREVDAGRMSSNLGPLQAGTGNIANAMVCGLIESPFENLTIYSEVLQGSIFDLIDAGKLHFASDGSITLSPRCNVDVLGDPERYKGKLVLRPQGISSHPEVIRRLSIIGISAVLEFDIYDNANSTHAGSTEVMNDIDGSSDLARSAHLAIFVTRSIVKGGNIPSVVPMVSHVDHTEHNVGILVTEQGLVDLRDLTPRERARIIIESCVHPPYQAPLLDYLEVACAKGGHTPHLLREALAWHLNLEEHGYMLVG